jgi:prepilin-type processing-associated H-X9-DG protein
LTGNDSGGIPVFNTRYLRDGELTGLTVCGRNDYAGNGYHYWGLDYTTVSVSGPEGAVGTGGTGTAGMDAIFQGPQGKTFLSQLDRSIDYVGDDYFAGRAAIFYPTSVVTVGQVLDGTSSTYFFGEKYVNPDRYETGFGHGDCFDALGGAGPDNLRYCAANGPWGSYFALTIRDTPGYEPSEVWGSCHAGGFNMAMCDGSVRQVSYGISSIINDRLGNRADGKVVDVSDMGM